MSKRRKLQHDKRKLSAVEVAIDSFTSLQDPIEQSEYLKALVDECSRQQLSVLNTIIAPKLKLDILGSLPVEIASHILQYLPYQTLCRVAPVSSRYARLVDDQVLWKRLCIQHNYLPEMPQVQRLELKDGYYDLKKSPLTPAQSRNRSMHSLPNSYKDMFIRNFTLAKNWELGRYGKITFDAPRASIVTCLLFEGDRLILATDNQHFGLIEIYSLTTGTLESRLRGHDGGVWALEFRDDVLVSGGCDRDLRVWQMSTGTCLQRMEGHTSTVRCLRILDNKRAISGSRDNTMRLWDIEQGTTIRRFIGHTGSIRCMAVQNGQVVSGSYDNSLRLWDIESGECLHVMDEHHAQIYSVCFDSGYICSGSLDADIRVWNPKTGECTHLLEGHEALVGHMQLNGTKLVSGGSDGRICIWNVETGKMESRFNAHASTVTTIQFKGNRLVSGGDDGVKLWCLKSQKLLSHVICSNADDAVPQEASDGLLGLTGVWRLQFDESHLVSAVQKGEITSIEVFNYADGLL